MIAQPSGGLVDCGRYATQRPQNTPFGTTSGKLWALIHRLRGA
jgi:hypothetical protein